MILFKENWNNYPDAIADFETPNKTFVEISAIYKKMGVDNHTFMLALHDPVLQGVNPRDPNLSEDMIARIIREQHDNPWYFFREILKIPSTAYIDGVSFRANRANIALIWLFFNHITTLLIQIRQTGKSVTGDGLLTYITNNVLKSDCTIFTKSDDLRTKNIKRLKEMYTYLPYYLQLKTKKDSNNTEKITIGLLNNTISTAVGQASKQAALNVGRGTTTVINIVDEFAYTINNEHTIGAMLAATGAAVDSAKAAGSLYGNIFLTTPGFLSMNSGKYAYKIYNECLYWNEKLLDCINEEDLEKTIRKNSPSGKAQVVVEMNHRQLGYTDEWLKDKIERAMSEGENVEADFLNRWVEGNETSPIPKEILELIRDNVIDPVFTDITPDNYIINWYVTEEESKRYKQRPLIMGLDTSEANGGDDMAMVIRDPYSGDTIATCFCSETNIITYSEWITDWLIDYPFMTLIIEKRSTGSTILDQILRILPMRNIDPFKRLFNWVVNEMHVNKEYKDIVNTPVQVRDNFLYIKYKNQFGYATSGGGRSSRDNLYGTAFNAATRYVGKYIKDKTIYRQLTTLIRKNGRIDHPVGEHDDSVISWLLSYWMLTSCNNLNVYNLNINNILSTVRTEQVKDAGGKDAVVKNYKNIEIKQEIDRLYKTLENERNPIFIDTIVRKILSLTLEIKDNDEMVLNINQLLDGIKKTRFIRRY